jgi:putative restriction endonuclease
MLTPEGHTIVEAAHFVPWSASHGDRPQNGMALCRLCHWSFDEGLMGVGDEYEVLVSKTVRQDNNFPGHVVTLPGRGIFKPQSSRYWPDMGSIKRHRKKIFRRR